MCTCMHAYTLTHSRVGGRNYQLSSLDLAARLTLEADGHPVLWRVSEELHAKPQRSASMGEGTGRSSWLPNFRRQHLLVE